MAIDENVLMAIDDLPVIKFEDIRIGMPIVDKAEIKYMPFLELDNDRVEMICMVYVFGKGEYKDKEVVFTWNGSITKDHSLPLIFADDKKDQIFLKPIPLNQIISYDSLSR